jgi:hypothetical protein
MKPGTFSPTWVWAKEKVARKAHKIGDNMESLGRVTGRIIVKKGKGFNGFLQPAPSIPEKDRKVKNLLASPRASQP